MRTSFLMDVNITEVDSHALEYVIDLIEKNMNDNFDNAVRGHSLFQNVASFAGLLKQEITMARREMEKANA